MMLPIHSFLHLQELAHGVGGEWGMQKGLSNGTRASVEALGYKDALQLICLLFIHCTAGTGNTAASEQ
jgi:hypothetical protein